MTTPPPPPPRITAREIGQLLRFRGTALVQYRDGSGDVIPDLDDPEVRADLPESAVVLRYPGRAWADDLLDQARKAAEEIEDDAARAKALDPRTLRAAAGRLGNADLTREHERMVRVLGPSRPARNPWSPPHDYLPLTQQEIDAWEDLLVRWEGPLILP